MNFYDSDYLQSRLVNSIIRYEDEPFYVKATNFSARGAHSLIGYRIEDIGGNDAIKCRLDKVDLRPVPLGFCPLPDKLIAYSRLPKRMWKIGLADRNLVAHVYHALNAPKQNLGVRLTRETLTCLDSTIRGDYLSFDAATELVQKGHNSFVPFHRDFAVARYRKTVQLIDRYVGQVGTVEDGVPVLKEPFIFLKEKMEKARG